MAVCEKAESELMTQHDHNETPQAPLASPIDVSHRPETDFMSDQIMIMRRECPEIWERIDAMSDGRFDSARCKSLFSADDSTCEGCGYNLKGNLSGVCPECGTPLINTHEARRMTSLRILDMLRLGNPEKWITVTSVLEKKRMENLERELQVEGRRRDEIRRKALNNWLDRKRGNTKE